MRFVLQSEFIRQASWIAILGMLAGCASLVPPPPAAQATYDLGPAAFREGTGGRAAVEVVAPPRLDQTRMRFRLSYAEPYAVRTYTKSRWEAPPARLLDAYFAQAWPGPNLGECRLVVAVDEWIHEFAAPDRSRVRLAIDAQLQDRAGKPLSERRFVSDVAAMRHDAPGMAAASGAAAGELLSSLSAWLAADGTSAGTLCQPR